jgi:FixJ family two-component response regulator
MKLGDKDLVQKPADLKALTGKIKKAQAHKMIIVEKKAEGNVQHTANSYSARISPDFRRPWANR